jgi:hypothetical protein
MIRKSGSRFSEKIMLHELSMIRKSGSRFSGQIMLRSGHRISYAVRWEVIDLNGFGLDPGAL